MQSLLRRVACMLLLLVTGLSVVRPQPLSGTKEKFLGAGSGSYLFRDFDKYWNQITPGNDGKWGSVEIVRGTYNWTNLDKIYGYGAGRGLLYKHHTLVWGNQQPGWLSSLDSAAQREAVGKWIAAVGARYQKMALVDVVNEPLHTPLPVYKNALGGDGTTGWDWVITAFEFARDSCPKEAKLILNDYNILSSTASTTNFLAIVQLLKERHLIDGIGIQGHYFEFRSEIGTTGGYVYDIQTIKANLERLASTGLPVYITEFDIDEKDDANQLSQYKIYFPIFWNHPAVKGITLWGFIEGDVWTSHPYTYLIKADGTERPALAWLRTFIAGSPATGVSENAAQAEASKGFHVRQNYPNPFNPSTVISYELPSRGRVRVNVSTVLGGDAAVLVDEEQEAGSHRVTFNADKLAAGMYFYTVQFGSARSVHRMVVLK